MLWVALDTVEPKNLGINIFSDSEMHMKFSNFSEYVHLVLQERCWLLTSLLIGL